MKKFLFILLVSVSFTPFLHSEENVDKPRGIIALGKYNKPKHTRYEIGSIGGTKFVHDKIYEKGKSSDSGYGCRSTENVSGLWTKIKMDSVTVDAQMAYSYNTYKYDRGVNGSHSAHARFHGHSIDTVIEARYRPFEAKTLKISPIVGLGYKYTRKRAYTEEYSTANRSYEKNNLKTLNLRLGAFLERDCKVFSRDCWVYSKLMYARVLHASDSKVKYTVDGGNTQSERTNFQKKNGFEMSIGTAINVFRRWDVDVCYQLFADGKLSSHGALWKVCYNF